MKLKLMCSLLLPLLSAMATVAIQQQPHHTVALQWKASISPNIRGYNLYRSTISGGYFGLIANVTSTRYVDSGVKARTTYYYVATAVATNKLESARSNQATATIP
jgi:fibronectin type 3 domain-containing protein